MIVRARLKTRDIDGVQMMDDDVPVGKEYIVDLSRKTRMHWESDGRRMRDLDCVPDVIDGGWLPLDVLDLIG